MNNNNDNKYGRTMDFSRHQEIVQELRQQLIVMKQQIKTFEEEATTTTTEAAKTTSTMTMTSTTAVAKSIIDSTFHYKLSIFVKLFKMT